MGHYIAARCLGFDSHIHFAEEVSLSRRQYSKADDLWITIAGPLVNFILALIGLFWLHQLKKRRVGTTLTWQDWLALILSLNAMRWLSAFGILQGITHLTDEATFSQGIGWPRWLLPACLGIIAIIALIVVVRFLPRGNRRFPLLVLFSGGILGAFVWLKFIGPILLP